MKLNQKIFTLVMILALAASTAFASQNVQEDKKPKEKAPRVKVEKEKDDDQRRREEERRREQQRNNNRPNEEL